MSTKILKNIFSKNLKNSNYIHLYSSLRSIEKKNPLFTKFGDNGKSKIKSGELGKDHIIFEAIGVTEELNSFIGLAREFVLEDEKLLPLAEKLRKIQLVLIDATDIVSNLKADESSSIVTSQEIFTTDKITNGDITELETLISHYGTLLPPMEKVVVPGGGKASATLHVAKAVCRRCERILIKILKNVDTEKNLLIYMNRLSSYLSQAARISAKFANKPESIYQPHFKGDSNTLHS